MTPRRHDPQAGPANPALALTRELHGYLLEVLVQKFGDELRVENAQDPENGLVGYRFTIHGAVCLAGVVPFNAVCAVLSFNGRLGRVYHGYTSALNWLGNNRAFNTLAVAHQQSPAQRRELWVASNRNTLAGDIAGIRCELEDFCAELWKAVTGLKLWFPQFFEASALAQFELEAGGDEALAAALTDPAAALRTMDGNDAPVLYCYLTRWLGRWEAHLQMLDSAALQELAVERPEVQAALPLARLRGYRALGHHQQLLDRVLPILSTADLPAARNAAFKAECLSALGHHEDALETLRSAELDDEPWVHFVRSCAAMELGRQEDAAAHFGHYEAIIGADILARKKLAAISAKNAPV